MVRGSALAGIDLDTVKPTAEELKQARDDLAKLNTKEARSKMACMSAWLAKHPCSAASSRGQQRQDYLATYLVHQLRNSKAVNKKHVTHTEDTTRFKANDINWWSEEQMDKEIGPIKAAALRSSGKLDTQPCSVTGSNDEKLIEYGVPVCWQRLLDESRKGMQVSGTSDATQDDIAHLVDMRQTADAAAGPPQPPDDPSDQVIKKEKLTDEEALTIEFNAFMLDIKNQLRSFQDMEIHSRQLLVHLMKCKYTEALQIDVKKHVTRLSQICKILSRGCVDTMKVPEFPKLKKAMQEVSKTHKEMQLHATRFGFEMPGASSRTRRVRRRTE